MNYFNDELYYERRRENNELVVTDEYLYYNIDEVLNTPHLTYIIINFSDIPVQEDILIRLSEVKTLVRLQLSFIFTEITKIPDAIFNIKSLEFLHISNIRTNELQSDIGNLKNLKKLTVIQTEIKTVPESISKLTSLEVLELEINSITHLPTSIGNMKSLKAINLMSNQLSEIPESLGSLPNLKVFDLSFMPSLINFPQSVIDLQSKNKLELIIRK